MRLIFGRIDGSHRVLEARDEALASKPSRALTWTSRRSFECRAGRGRRVVRAARARRRRDPRREPRLVWAGAVEEAGRRVRPGGLAGRPRRHELLEADGAVVVVARVEERADGAERRGEHEALLGGEAVDRWEAPEEGRVALVGPRPRGRRGRGGARRAEPPRLVVLERRRRRAAGGEGQPQPGLVQRVGVAAPVVEVGARDPVVRRPEEVRDAARRARRGPALVGLVGEGRRQRAAEPGPRRRAGEAALVAQELRRRAVRRHDHDAARLVVRDEAPQRPTAGGGMLDAPHLVGAVELADGDGHGRGDETAAAAAATSRFACNLVCGSLRRAVGLPLPGSISLDCEK